MHNLRKNLIKGTAVLLASTLVMNVCIPSGVAYAGTSYDYSNSIYSGGTEDTFIYSSNDKVITTKTGIKRTIPKVSGKYDRSEYPIPLLNQVPSSDAFKRIMAENKELMDNAEKAIANGTLTKHVAADGQFYGSIADDVLGVEKKVYVNTNTKGSHSLASYVPAGEIATVTLSEEALTYVKKGWIKLSIGTTINDGTEYEYNHGENNRMPYLGKTFSVSGLETKVGTPFGGMLFIEISDQVPSGLQIDTVVKGVVDAPYYDLGQTTSEEWKVAKDAPGLYAELRTPYLRFIVPSYFIREIEDPYEALMYWNNATTLSATLMSQEKRTTPMTLLFDDYITAGCAYAMVGYWYCVLPHDWATGALDYEGVINNGSWGLLHEINHHYQNSALPKSTDWGVGYDLDEVTNNTLNTISYLLYTNIASYRGEEGLEDWNKVADPYSSLKQQIFEGVEYYEGVPNGGNFMYSTLAHELGPITLAKIIKSTYEDTTFHGIQIPAYDYMAERQGTITRDARFDDYAYRICVASKRDYTWYLQEELRWKISQSMVKKIQALNYEKVIPVQSVYGMGEVGRETGRPFYIPSTGYVFNFEESLVSPGKTTVVNVSKPKYGTLTKQEDGTYAYAASSSMPEGAKDEFVLTVAVEADGIKRETKLNCTIGLLYDSVYVEHHAITKWDVYEALETLKTSTPYKTTASSGMQITTDDGNNLAKATGYFTVPTSGTYTFQAYGDDRAVFELNLSNEKTLQSLTVDYAGSVEEAYSQSGATHFTAYLEANTPYSYTLIANNNAGAGWANVNIRSTANGATWESISKVCNNVKDINKSSDRKFKVSDPVYVRPSTMAASNTSTVTGVSVISTPQGVEQNANPGSNNEGNPASIVDGDENTYFHSTYIDEEKTEMPHEYIFDLGSEQSFNQIDILYRRSGDDCGVIGNYEIYVADQYDGTEDNWTLLAKDDSRQGNASAPNDIKKAVENTTAKYVKLRVLNNRGDYDLSIIAEVTFSMNSNVANVIAQNSSYIQYTGSWSKDTNGAFVNGATYNTTKGYFMYCFEGSESNLYVTKDVDAQVRIDGGEWKDVRMNGSLREPSYTVTTGKSGKHSVEVRATGQNLALNMISTDGSFYKGEVITVSNILSILGADPIQIPASQVSTFDPLAGITYTDTLGLKGLEITVSGSIGVPTPGTNKTYKLTYMIVDHYGNAASVYRMVTVTNQFAAIKNLAASVQSSSQVTLSWAKVNDADGYKVYRYNASAKRYDLVSTIRKNSTVSYKDSKLAGGTAYQYRVAAYKGGATVAQSDITVTTKLAAPKLAATATDKNVTLKWSKATGATGYKVYRYNTSKKRYDLISTITKNTVLSYKDSKVSAGTAYKYRVVAYKKSETSMAADLTATTLPGTAKISKITTTSKKATIRWAKVSSATGYEVYSSTSKNKGYKKVATINKAKTVTFTNSKLKGNKTYYYKVRTYKVVNGKKVYGAYSNVKSIKVKK